MTLTGFLLLVTGWPALVHAMTGLHRLTQAGQARLAAWPAYWLGAIALMLVPALLALVLAGVFSLVPGARPDFLSFSLSGPLSASFSGPGPVSPAPGLAGWQGALPEAGVSADPRPGQDFPGAMIERVRPFLSPVLLLAYGAGVLFAGLRLALGHWRVARIVGRAQPAPCRGGAVPVLITKETMTAFAWALPGGRARCIVVPQYLWLTLAPEKLDGIIAHEQAHLRRGDPQTGVILSVLGVLFWFNPFVCRLIIRWRLAAELASDALALSGAGPASRKAYAQTLVDALRVPAMRALPCPAAAFSTTKLKDEKMRLQRILKGNAMAVVGRREKIALGACAALMAVAGCAGAATLNGAPQSPEPGAAPAPSAQTAPIAPPAPPMVALEGDVGDEAMAWRQVITYADGERVERAWDDLSEEEKAEIRAELQRAREEMARARVEVDRARGDIERARIQAAAQFDEMEIARLKAAAEFAALKEARATIATEVETRGLSEEQRAEIEREIEAELQRAEKEIERVELEMERDSETLRRQSEALEAQD